MNFLKILLIILGTLSLLIGIVGIVVPGLPTTPFLLLTAALYIRSSDKLYNKLISNKHLGKYIIEFQTRKALPMKTKIISLIMMWTMITLSCSFFLESVWIRIVVIALGIIGSVVMFFILPTWEEKDGDEKPFKE
jgi:uncharacterized membrane protein YbaN (DUF454 family)